MAYVELNCVRAGLCAKSSEYRWCSAGRFYQGGTAEAGVKIPSLLGFESLKNQRHRQRGFVLFVDHLAINAGREDVSFPVEHAELEALAGQMDTREIADLVLRRTRWMVNSLILGSESFCAEMIGRFSLQTARYSGPRPFELGGCLYNGRQRAGPLLV